jgi:NAD(P)-dependent dehydrogenase (short-subunit alcohol dehydrogenase family)
MTIDTLPGSLADGGAFIIIGGAGGIGGAVARRLRSRQAAVLIAGRTQDRLEAAAFALGAEWAVVDAADFGAVDALVQRAADQHGRVAGIVNAAGSILFKPAHLTSFDEWQHVLALNLTTAFAVVRAAGRVMSGGGSVVLVSTVAASLGLPQHEAIAAAKGGVEGLVRAAAASYAGRGLRVNAVAPGLVDTPLAARITSNPKALESSRARHPLGRIGTPDDIAAPIEWLLDPATSWVTGQVVGVDGGMSTVRL